jgi:hypothetical protein
MTGVASTNGRSENYVWHLTSEMTHSCSVGSGGFALNFHFFCPPFSSLPMIFVVFFSIHLPCRFLLLYSILETSFHTEY